MDDNQQQEERKKTAKAIYEKLEEMMSYLHQRWNDEKEYEDIKEYGEAIKKELERVEGATFLKMSKRPFGFTYTLMGATYKVTINTREYGYERIK